MGGVSKGMRPEGFIGLLGHPERFLQQKEYCSDDQYEVHEKDYTGSDAARVNKDRASAYGSGRQCKVGYGSGEWCERGPGFFEDWLSECDIDKEEVVDMAARRRLDFCCLQETGWKGEGAEKMGEYKFFWMGCAKGIHGVGLLVAEGWIEKEVKCVSETDGGEGNYREDYAELDFCICATSWKTYAGERRMLHLIREDGVGDR